MSQIEDPNDDETGDDTPEAQDGDPAHTSENGETATAEQRDTEPAEPETDGEGDETPPAPPEARSDGGEDEVDVVDDQEGLVDEPEDEDEVDRGPAMDAEFIVEAEVLQETFEYIGTVVDEAKIHLEPTEWTCRAVDPANVGMVDLDVAARGFASYEVREAGRNEGVIGLNIVRIRDVLAGADADQLVTLTVDGERQNLHVEYGGHEFTIGLFNPDSIRQEPDLPSLDLSVEVNIDGGEVAQAAGFVNDVTDHIKLCVPEGGERFIISGEGDVDSYERVFEEPNFQQFPAEGAEALYSNRDYLKPVFDQVSEQEMCFEYGEDFPIKVHGNVMDSEDERVGDVTYMVAPRIRTE